MKMKIGQIVKLSGIPATTIYYYIKEGLLPEPERVNKRISLYDETLVERLKTIQSLQEKRFPLSSIKKILKRLEKGIPLEEAVSVENVVFGLPVKNAHELIDRDTYMERTGLSEEELEEIEQHGLILPLLCEKGKALYDEDDVAMGIGVFKLFFRFKVSPKEIDYYITLGRQITEKELALREKIIQDTTALENMKITIDLTKAADLSRAYYLRRLFQQMAKEKARTCK